jgi:hypothetical protein
MSASLTTLISRVQAQLIDDGTRFSTATCTAAIRACLKNVNERAPVNAATRIDVTADQYEYELHDEDSRAMSVIDILEWDDDGESHIPLSYDAYTEDDRLFFRLRTPLDTGEILARYTIPHTISELDSETESTPSARLDQIIVDGACVEALAYRAAARIETINLQQGVSDNYREAMQHFRNAYENGLQAYIRDQRSAVSEPRTDAWQEPYYNWDK